MSSLVPHSVDSFTFLLKQVEDDYQNFFSTTCKYLAVIGAFYTTYKVINITQEVFKALKTHAACQWLPCNKEHWKAKYGPWAVVTGGSEGIGRAYALELALRGLNVVIVSRSQEKLEKAKAIIEKKAPSVQIEFIVADFSSLDQDNLYRRIREGLDGKAIGLLVNNVGVMYDHPDVFLNIPSNKLMQLTSVNIGAATMMTHMLLPAMVERGHGGLVIMSSSACAQITPQMTAYAAGKKYLEYFLQGLAYEYRDTGVDFQCLTPFYVATQMTGFTTKLRKGLLVPDGSDFSKSAVNTLGHSQITCGYLSHTLMLWVSGLVPGWLWMAGATRINEQFKQESLQRQSSIKKV